MTAFLLVVTFLVVLMAGFILTILFLHRKRQIAYREKLTSIQTDYERNLLKTQLEIQEQTFQHISTEIHDNISLSLTLAKLHLHTLDWEDKEKSGDKIAMSIELLSKSISGFRDISKGLNADIIIQHGLLKAIEEELQRIRQVGLFGVEYIVTGNTVYMDNQKELIIFRIIQEGFNNIIKHAGAGNSSLLMHYGGTKLIIKIQDDGRGFDTGRARNTQHAGVKNMETRIKILKGEMNIKSSPGQGTTLLFKIPFD